MVAINWWDTIQFTASGRRGRPCSILKQMAMAGYQAPAIAANLSRRFRRSVSAKAVRAAAAARGIALTKGRPPSKGAGRD